MKKSLRIGLLGLLMGTTAFAGALTLNTQKTELASADANFTMEMEDGAAVRLVGTDENEYGIKYTAKLATSSYDAAAEYYVMIIPTGWLNTYNLSKTYDANCDYYGTLSAQSAIADRIMTMKATPEYVEDDGCYYFEGSIKTVKYENSFREYFGIAYMEKNGVRTYAEFAEGENIRSVSQVASAALNDKTAGWTDDEKASLKKMVKTAYNAQRDNDYTTVETAELPTISATSGALSLLSGDTHQIDTLTGVPENIGVKVEYTSSSPAQVKVDENGLLTANTVGSGATITATVLGEDYTVAEIAPVENILVGFDTETSQANIMQSTTSEWKENHDGRNGVVKTDTTAGGTYGNYKVKLYFDVNAAYMEALDFDYISIWVWIDEAGTWNIRSHEYTLETGIEGQKWQEIRIYQEEITTAKTTWVQNSSSGGARNLFNKAYAKDTKADWHLDHLFQIHSTANGEPKTVYIDSVSYVKFETSGEAPTTTGEYTLPTVTMNGSSAAPETSVTQGANALTVEQGKVELPTVGVYTMSYAFDYNGLTYEKTDSVKLANGNLEDFGNASTAMLYSYQGASGTHYADSAALALLGERTGVVGSALTVSGTSTYLNLTFNKTADELKALLCANTDGTYGWDYISFQIYVSRNDWSGYLCVDENGAEDYQLDYTLNSWSTITLTREQICGKYKDGGFDTSSIWSVKLLRENNNQFNFSADDVIAKFCEMHCAGSATGTLFRLPSTSINGIYIDSVSIGKNA